MHMRRTIEYKPPEGRFLPPVAFLLYLMLCLQPYLAQLSAIMEE